MGGYQSSKVKLRIEGNMVVGTGEDYPAQCIGQAIACIVEARKHLTIWEFEKFIRDNVVELGGHGFLCSIGEAILKGATIDACAVRE